MVPDIKPLDVYDCTKAKICASVGWLLAKSYGCAGRFGQWTKADDCSRLKGLSHDIIPVLDFYIVFRRGDL